MGRKTTAKDDPEQVWKEVFERSVSTDDPCQPWMYKSLKLWNVGGHASWHFSHMEREKCRGRDASLTHTTTTTTFYFFNSDDTLDHPGCCSWEVLWIIQSTSLQENGQDQPIAKLLVTQEIRRGYPTPTIDKVSFCFEIVVQPTCFLLKLLLTTFVSRPAYLSSLKTLPITLPSTTTPWIIQGVVPEKYFGSSKVLSPPREWPGPAYRKAPWALRRYWRGYPTPTIDKVSFCFVNPTYLL